MDIVFGKIHAENFMSFKEVEFDFNGFGSKIVLVTGRNDDIDGDDCRNGAGKTTVFNALLYAIYGEVLNPLKAAKHIANWNCSAKDDVKITLSVSVDGSEYEIDRFLVGRKKSMELHVYRRCGDGGMEELTRSTIAETQRLIETDIVPCGKDGFLRCILLTADKNYNFFELGKAAKNEFFEALFELTTYSTMFQKLHRDTLDESNSLVAHSRTIDQLNASIVKLKAERDAERTNRKDMEDAKSALELAKERLGRFDSDNGVVIDERGNIAFGNSDEYDRIVERGRGLSDRVKKGKELLERIRMEMSSLETKRHSINSEVDSERRAIASMESAISAHGHITDILCDDCLPKYRAEMKLSDYEDEIRNRKGRIDELLKSKVPIEPQLSEKSALYTKYTAGVKMLEEDVERCRGELMSLKGRRMELQTARNRILGDISNAEYRIRVLTETAARSFDAPIRSLEQSLASSKGKYAETDRKIAHLKALESVLKPESIRKSVVSDMLKELNFRIYGYLSKMGSNYSCRFDEDFDAIFESSNGIETEYNNFSSGEKMRLSIACCFAFKDFMQVRLNIHSNILVIDEYIDSNLDPLSVNGIIELIRYMVGSERMAAFIISHRSEVLNTLSDSEILVTKKDNKSSITITNKD